MAVTVSNTEITEFNTEVEVTENAATSAVIDETEVFTVSPGAKDPKVVIQLANGIGHGAVAWSVAAGDYWAAPLTALTGSIAAGTIEAIVLEGAKYKNQDGTIAITLTPASGKRLATDHAAWIASVELP